MTSTTPPSQSKLIHIGRIYISGKWCYLLLRKKDTRSFVWFEEQPDGTEIETEVSAETIEEAIRLAIRHWKKNNFNSVLCGFRYPLPERDEHGINALFHQMVSSYSSMNGIYYDEELGNNCFVQNTSDEAHRLWQFLKIQNRL